MIRNLFFYLVLFFIQFPAFISAQSAVIPTPENYNRTSATPIEFTSIFIQESSLNRAELQVLQDWSNEMGIATGQSSSPMTVQLINAASTLPSDKDYYTIETTNKGKTTIYYSSEASKIYALSTLLQLIEKKENQLQLFPFQLYDQAKFGWRGLHLDVCRHFFTIDEVKKYIDVMAFYKFNRFHWHLTDDQGWRIEIKKYPKLTEIGGFRDSTLNKHYSTIPRTWNTDHYGGYYTQDQIREVVKYAQVRGVTVVPEIEMPGHARAALAAYPELSCNGKQNPVTGLWGVFDDIFCSKAETVSFLQDVLTEVIDLFPSEYIHVGGDEAPKTRWKECQKCQANIKKHNLKDEHELQSWFVQQMDQFLTKRGRKLIGWDEILEGGLSENAAVMSWRGEAGGIEAANLKHEVVMSPGTHCYFDHYQGNSLSEPIAFGGYTPLEKVYEFNPIPSAIKEENKKYILGAQANLWTEYILDFPHVQYMIYPRALALIQNLWSYNKVDFATFKEQLLNKQLSILKNKGVNYSLSFARPSFHVEKTAKGINVTTLPEVSQFTSVKMWHQKTGNGDSINLTGSHYKFDRQKKGSSMEAILSAKESTFNSTSSIGLTFHKGLGLNVELLTQPHSSYSVNKSIALVDGIRGQRPWKGHEWLGFNTGKVEIIVTLDPKITYKKLRVSLLSDNGSWIYLPNNCSLYALNKENKWVLVDTIEAIKGEEVSFDLPKKVQQVKLVLNPMEIIPQGLPGAGYEPFTFIDELIFE